MKFVCISDIHCFWDSIDVPHGDALIIAGDITNTGKPSDIEAFGKWVEKLPHRYKILIAGNHDLWFERFPELARDLVPSVIYLENNMVEIEGIRIWGSPVTPKFYHWAFMLDGPQRERVWKQIPNDTDIVVTHGPPYGILDQTLDGQSAGCKRLARHIKRVKPKYHIFGHIHEGRGVHTEDGTTYMNVSICTRKYVPSNKPLCFELKSTP
jgi:Icc-related predicted phosphoesterase